MMNYIKNLSKGKKLLGIIILTILVLDGLYIIQNGNPYNDDEGLNILVGVSLGVLAMLFAILIFMYIIVNWD